MKPAHPTRQQLIDTVVVLLDDKPSEAITTEEVLEASGISRGSLYHHFEDFAELLSAAQVTRFSRYVDQSIEALTTVMLTVGHDRAAMLQALRQITIATQAPESQGLRFERATALGRASSEPHMRAMLNLEQTRLTEAIADIVREAQERGLFRPTLDARTVAVLIQAYTLGKVVDDVVDNPMDPDAWNDLIMQIIENVLAAPA